MNTMIKGFAVAAAMLVFTSVKAADTSYLYWMTENLSSFAGAEWNYAKVSWNNGTGTGYLTTGDGAQFEKTSTVDGDFMAMRVAIGSELLGESYKYALELFNSDGKQVGYSLSVAWDPKFIGGESMAQSQAVFSGFQVPEPTSGLLALLGFAVLGLRRKQKIA